MTQKICNKCNVIKDLIYFFSDKGCGDGKATICKNCKTENTIEWRKNNRDKYNEHQRKWRKNHREQLRYKGLKQRHNISKEQFLEMQAKQNNLCAICLKPPKGFGHNGKYLHVDHDHGTGQIRELLCDNCNKGIGNLQDDPNILNKAIDYLTRHGKILTKEMN